MMTDMYGDDYVVLVLSLPESNIVQSRKTRSLLATDDVSKHCLIFHENYADMIMVFTKQTIFKLSLFQRLKSSNTITTFTLSAAL